MGVIAPFALIYVFNWIMFVIIVVSICRQQARMSAETGNKELKVNAKKRLLMLITLSLLFGLGWGLGLAGTESLNVQWLRYSFQLCFIVLTGFQGLFLFILYCLRISRVRRIWLKWYYLATGQRDKASTLVFTRSRSMISRGGHRSNGNSQKIQLGSFGDENKVELKKYTFSKELEPEPTIGDSPGTKLPLPKEDQPITEDTVKKYLSQEDLNLTSTFDKRALEADVDLTAEQSSNGTCSLNQATASGGVASNPNNISKSSLTRLRYQEVAVSTVSTLSGLEPQDV